MICEKAEDTPSGLVNVLACAEPTTGAAAVAQADTRIVVFVGSVEAGAQVAAAAACNIVLSVLELGGKSANIVFKDANLPRAIVEAQAAIVGGARQSYIAGSRCWSSALSTLSLWQS